MAKRRKFKITKNAEKVLSSRYLLKDKRRSVIEAPEEMFRRVARAVSKAELKFSGKKERKRVEEAFFEVLSELEFLPNSPTLMNAGTEMGQLSACFVIPIEDSMEGIFEAVKNTALIHQTGGGTGFSFSRLRPRGEVVSSTKGSASGPVSFMKIFDTATEVIVQGGRRRGANMGVLRCDHPDILEFIKAKADVKEFTNFNISVAVTDAFIKAALNGKNYCLLNPATGKKEGTLNAKEVFDLIVKMAWKTGDPGLIFIDEINRKNPTPKLGKIETTNPCGELPLLPYESCNLGSINLSKVARAGKADWKKLERLTEIGVRFLDDVIEVNRFVLPQIKEMTRGNRKIGLGVMGFADLLVKLRIPYNSRKAVDLAERIMESIRKVSVKASEKLAKERGTFPNYKSSVYPKKKLKLRNATLNTIAPTGTISIIAGCSSGIEPLFALSFVRNVLGGKGLLEVNGELERVLKDEGIYSKPLMEEIARSGSVSGMDSIPERIRRVFVTSRDILPKWHVKIQAAFQKHVDNSVSKTINLPEAASPEDVRDIYLLAYKLKCKGITVYRYGTKKDQVLSVKAEPEKRLSRAKHLCAGSEYSGGCPSPQCHF